jgi:hypothetical protein
LSPYTGWTPPRHPTLDPKSSEDSNAPRRGFMPSGAVRLPALRR